MTRGFQLWRREPAVVGCADRAGAFTLVEIMIVVAIIGLFAAAGLPSMIKMFRPDPLKKAVNDVIEGCSHARAQAILSGVPMEFVVRAEDGALVVREAPRRQKTAETSQTVEIVFGSEPPRTSMAPRPNFNSALHPDVAVQMLDVNFVDHMQEEEAHVRFHPNGTCDDFTIVLEWEGGIRKLTSEVVTSLLDLEVMR